MTENDPSLHYIQHPGVTTKEELDYLWRQSNAMENEKVKTQNMDFIEGMARLQTLEDAIVRNAIKNDRKTIGQIVLRRKEELIQSNMEKFGKQKLGIHG